MKRRNLISPLALLSGLFLVMFMISCGKDGAVGPAGANGPKGDTGPKGDSGVGTVFYSGWLDVPFKPDTIHLAGGRIDTIGYYATIDAPKLTKELLSSVDVKVYINSNDISDPVIYSLPYTAQSGLRIDVSAYTQKIELYANADVGTRSTNGKKYQQYRYMIIPGNAQARSAAPVNWSNYAAVKAYLGLKD
ncbi:collagen-like protein [Chitinophaga polysaccharea]|uniref:collagen-like triple helix repeat-containing protein n=1 Tax=Chitinophaga polysaccharea TaxID=1293035 RepID=UPI0014557E82|nr:collagen-like protein [Chitinophaga polysaccharea]NLR60401.1 collagen-like protein [Chitinophaga polysaccharea]